MLYASLRMSPLMIRCADLGSAGRQWASVESLIGRWMEPDRQTDGDREADGWRQGGRRMETERF